MLIACFLIYLFIYFLISLLKNKMRGSEGGPERGLKGVPERTNIL